MSKLLNYLSPCKSKKNAEEDILEPMEDDILEPMEDDILEPMEDQSSCFCSPRKAWQNCLQGTEKSINDTSASCYASLGPSKKTLKKQLKEAEDQIADLQQHQTNIEEEMYNAQTKSAIKLDAVKVEFEEEKTSFRSKMIEFTQNIKKNFVESENRSIPRLFEEAIKDMHHSQSEWNELVNDYRKILSEKERDVLPCIEIGGVMKESYEITELDGPRKYTKESVAIAYAIFLAELNEGPYHNHVMTCVKSPSLICLQGDLSEKFEQMKTFKSLQRGVNVKDLMTYAIEEGKHVPETVAVICGSTFEHCSEGREMRRLKKGGSKMLQSNSVMCIMLTWDSTEDLDLHCYTPCESHIYYNERQVKNGCLDIDARGSDARIENIYWDSMPEFGEYKFFVKCCGTKEDEPTPIQVTFKIGSVTHTVDYVLNGGEHKIDLETVDFKGLDQEYWGSFANEEKEKFDNYSTQWAKEKTALEQSYDNVPRLFYWGMDDEKTTFEIYEENNEKRINGCGEWALSLKYFLNDDEIMENLEDMLEAVQNAEDNKTSDLEDMLDDAIRKFKECDEIRNALDKKCDKANKKCRMLERELAQLKDEDKLEDEQRLDLVKQLESKTEAMKQQKKDLDNAMKQQKKESDSVIKERENQIVEKTEESSHFSSKCREMQEKVQSLLTEIEELKSQPNVQEELETLKKQNKKLKSKVKKMLMEDIEEMDGSEDA